MKQRSNNTNVQNKSVISWVRFAGHHPGRSVAGPVSNQAAGNEYFHGQNEDRITSSRNDRMILMKFPGKGMWPSARHWGGKPTSAAAVTGLLRFFGVNVKRIELIE